MKKGGVALRISRFLVLAVLLASSLTFSAPKFETKFRDDHFLAEGLLHLNAADLDGDGRDELLLVGRDYTDPQVMLYVLSPEGERLAPVWQSPDVMEDKSPVFLTVGCFFPGDCPAAAIMTNHRLNIYGWTQEDGYRQLASIAHSLSPWGTAATDWNGDGVDELLVSRAVKTDSQGFVKRLEVYGLEDGTLTMLAASPAVGNIRSLTAGDLDGDGRDEIIAEAGKASAPGRFYIYSAGNAQWTLKIDPVKLVNAPVYGTTVAEFDGEPYLCTASERGKADFFRWVDGKPQLAGEISFSAGLVDIAAGRFWPGQFGLAVIAYPQTVHLLKLKEGAPQ